MSSRLSRLLFVMCLLSVCAVVRAERSTQSLVDQLGAPNFKDRVAAEQQLLELGAPSLSAVSKAARSEDLEVRLRAQRLIQLLQRMVITESETLILTNPWTLPASYAPGWELFHEVAGDAPPARKLYLEMLQQEPTLMLALDMSADEIQIAFEQRCADLRTFIYQRSGQHVHPATVATLLFLSVHPDTRPSLIANSIIDNLLNDSQFRMALSKSTALTSILSFWIQTPQQSSAQTRLSHAATHDLPAGIYPAYEILDAPFDRSRALTQNAIMYLAKHGGHAEMDRLEELLESKTVLYPNHRVSNNSTKTSQVQVRDVALLALVHMTRQPMDPYEFNGRRTDRRFLYAPNSGGFKNDTYRDAAIERWKKWRSEHLKVPLKSLEDASEGALSLDNINFHAPTDFVKTGAVLSVVHHSTFPTVDVRGQ